MSKISDLFSSPLSNIINIPKTENKLLKASLYNCLAIVLLAVIGASTVSVYFLFEIFIKPLMWAVLVGTCIFPFKRSLTCFVRTWIKDIDNSGKPLILGVIFTPFNLFNNFSELLTDVIIRRFKLFLFYIFGIPMIYSVYNLGVFAKLLQITASVYFMASDILALFGSKVISIMILTLVVMLFTSIVFLKNSNVRILKIISCSIWILTVVHLSNLAGNFALFIFTSMMLLLIIGGITDVLDIDITKLSFAKLVLFWEFICKPYKYSTKEDESMNISEFEEELLSGDDPIEGFQSTPANEATLGDTNSANKTPGGDNEESSASGKLNQVMNRLDSIFGCISGLLSPVPRIDIKRLSVRGISRVNSRLRQSSVKSPKKISNKTMVSRAFTFLLWSHIIVYSWSHFSVLVVIVIALILVAVKKIVMKLEIGETLSWIISLLKQKMTDIMGNKQEIFVPGFIRGTLKIFLQFDSKLKKILNAGLDSFVSVSLIALILLSAIFLTIFLAIQVHSESLHLIALTSNVLNSTMSSELYSWLPEKKDVISIIETMTSNIYLFGREWISKKIDQLFDTNAYNKARIEEQALELWEKLYQRVLLKNNTNITVASVPIGNVILNRHYSVTSIQQQISGLWDLLTSFDLLDFKKISDLIHENLGLLSTVIESLWLFIRSNINLVLSLTTGIFSAILGGGTVVLNFLLSLIIFLSALFYLLAYSKNRYLPLQCISNMAPTADDNPILQSIYLSVENGVSAVFAVTLKMACFYGFYTSLTHFIFGVNLVVIPSIMAAILAAVPIVGTYWAAIPAITELVFVNQDYVAASILLVLHFLPMYVIDTAIYSEIKETGHPYLTGLAIAGGVCWLGLQGVVIGPLLLCSLVIVLNMFKTLMNQYSAETTLSVTRTKLLERSVKKLKKSKSCDRSALLSEDCNSSLIN